MLGLFLLALMLAPTVSAQTASPTMLLPRAGQSFTFGIIEGPDNLLGDSAQAQTSLTLTVVSMYAGCGVITSPSGYLQGFTFAPGAATVIALPYNLMQVKDLGKTNKGILVHTSEPVNLVLHDYVPFAGDASQLLPDEALDTNYVSFGWGIYDDVLDPEHNNSEILVTSASDSTLVTITPSVKTRLSQPAGVPFTVLLNRGECYIVKADTSDHPSDPSLSGSKILSSKPVSVIAGLTCAYVPLGVESCNELMDEIIGKKWWGSHFFVQPLGRADSTVELVLTSDKQFFATINNGFAGSTNGRLKASFAGAAEIRTTALVEAHQLAPGCNGYLSSDPTLVTVLDTSLYSDTMVWNTPQFGTFANWVPIIFRTADLSTILLDGTPLSKSGEKSAVIHATAYSAINPSIYPGLHTLISPTPIFAIVAGFDVADAYSFMPGTAGALVPHDTVSHTLQLRADSAQACSDFGVTASMSTAILASEGLMSLTIPITYDPATLHIAAVEPHAVLMNAHYTIDSSTPGTLTITLLGEPFITGSDLFKIIFQGWKSVAATTVGKNSTPSACGDAVETITLLPATFAVNPSTDTLRRTLALANARASICTPLTIALTADSIFTPEDRFVLSKIEVTFDTSTQDLVSSTPGKLLSGITHTVIGQASGDYKLLVTSPIALAGSDTLLVMQFLPHALSAGTTVHAHITYLRCGDTLTRDLTLSYPVTRIYDTAHTTLTISTSSVSFGNQAIADISLAGLPATADIKQFDLYLTYNHDVLTYDLADLTNTLTRTWPQPMWSPGRTTDTLHFTSLASLGTSGALAHLSFMTFVADSNFSPIAVSSSLPGMEAGCPITFTSPEVSAVFLGKDLCGDSLLRAFMLGEQIVIDRAEITSEGNLHIIFRATVATDVSLSLTDMLGRTVWSGETSCVSGRNERDISLPAGLHSGSFTLRAASGRTIISKRLILMR